jgi:signal recognition particle subunit SEC65
MVYIVSEFIFYINILYSSLNINAPVEEDIKNPLNHSLKLKNQTIVILKKKKQKENLSYIYFLFFKIYF